MVGEKLPDGDENADIDLAVTLAFGSCAVIAEEGFDALGEVGGLLTVDLDDECRAFAAAVVDDYREFVEPLGVVLVAEVLGNEIGEFARDAGRKRLNRESLLL